MSALDAIRLLGGLAGFAALALTIAIELRDRRRAAWLKRLPEEVGRRVTGSGFVSLPDVPVLDLPEGAVLSRSPVGDDGLVLKLTPGGRENLCLDAEGRLSATGRRLWLLLPEGR